MFIIEFFTISFPFVIKFYRTIDVTKVMTTVDYRTRVNVNPNLRSNRRRAWFGTKFLRKPLNF